MENPAKNILVVDDHPTNRKLLRAMLESEGFNILEAADGVEALTFPAPASDSRPCGASFAGTADASGRTAPWAAGPVLISLFRPGSSSE